MNTLLQVKCHENTNQNIFVIFRLSRIIDLPLCNDKCKFIVIKINLYNFKKNKQCM